MFGTDFSRDPESCGRSRVRKRSMATVGIQAGFVEEAPSQTGEGYCGRGKSSSRGRACVA